MHNRFSLNLRLLFIIFLILGNQKLDAQQVVEIEPQEILRFVFRPSNDTLLLKGNEAEFKRLYSLVDQHLPLILSGQIPVRVNGYSTSAASHQENIRLASVRSNRVKSEIITNKKLQEKHFITTNYAEAYQGQGDLVVLTIRIPDSKQEVKPDPPGEAPEPDFHADTEPEPPGEAPAPGLHADTEPAPAILQPAAEQAYYAPFAIRTNLLYDALLTPTLGIEWRINPSVAIKVDASIAHWGNEHGRVQKIWLASPEVRWYLLQDKRFYVGLGANIGEVNLYGGLAKVLSGEKGYQGNIYGGGLTIGYQLPISNRFAFDFNLGLGYTRFEYDTFTISNGVRVYKDPNQTKNFWGPTQAGISLVWFIK